MSKEIFLKDDSLITSKTDLGGKIVYANDDFLNYAGYKMQDVLHRPHNIVRHEDMPKTVFKFLWDHVKRGEEIFAFVKNKSKNGDFYWVFANVTPSFDVHNKVIGYYSVRRKPNPKAISSILSLYNELLRVEKQGLNVGAKFLEDFCLKENKSYNELIFSLQETK